MNQRNVISIISVFMMIMVLVSFKSVNSNKRIDNLRIGVKDTTKTNPKINIQVEKEYDDNGNIIRYDSSYTYIYTNAGGTEEELNIDSIFESFEPYFFRHGLDIMNDPFEDFFEHDTLYQRHFFDDDFFMHQFENDMFRFEEMIQQMDSLRNQFLKQNYPNIEQPDEPDKKNKTKGVEI